MMNAQTGRSLTRDEHIKQSIKDILLTPIGSRVMRRHYGSYLFHLIDQPNHEATQLKMMSACVMALTAYEPRITLDSINFVPDCEKLTLNLVYTINDESETDYKTLNLEL